MNTEADGRPHTPQTAVIDVWADITCPFTHVGLHRLVRRREELGRQDVCLRVRPWPLELVNGAPLDPHHVAEEVIELRRQVAPHLFRGFDTAAFPASSLAALAVADVAYERSVVLGEQVSLELRDLLFEEGVDVADPDVLHEVAARHGITHAPDDASVRAEYARGARRGVRGSPHFFVGDADFFCPGLDIHRQADGSLHVTPNVDTFERFITTALDHR